MGPCFSHECFLDIQELPNKYRNIIREDLTILLYEVRWNEILWADFCKKKWNWWNKFSPAVNCGHLMLSWVFVLVLFFLFVWVFFGTFHVVLNTYVCFLLCNEQTLESIVHAYPLQYQTWGVSYCRTSVKTSSFWEMWSNSKGEVFTDC